MYHLSCVAGIEYVSPLFLKNPSLQKLLQRQLDEMLLQRNLTLRLGTAVPFLLLNAYYIIHEHGI